MNVKTIDMFIFYLKVILIKIILRIRLVFLKKWANIILKKFRYVTTTVPALYSIQGNANAYVTVRTKYKTS